jgi:hypothetical protein
VRSLALIPYLWDKAHYRNGCFQDDMVKNLRNVGVPGTGMALSFLCVFGSMVFTLFMFLLLPLVCAVAALYEQLSTPVGTGLGGVASAYRAYLLHPTDWFSFWRLNCRLATYHAYVTKETDYRVEDKWTFLTVAKKLDIPVTPWLDVGHIICKHRNEEGGLGFQAFSNATVGGDWIIQEKITNADSISALLPSPAPLSTFRVISSSTGGLYSRAGTDGGDEGADKKTKEDGEVRILSCVWRAGRANAITDHKCVMFDVDCETGVIREGVTSAHWYSLGLDKVFFSPWTSPPAMKAHPDTGLDITGRTIPEMPQIIELVQRAHAKMCPGVPMVGWDVAVTPTGLMLLEANLSCNFFRASFDEEGYLSFVLDYFQKLEDIETVDSL